MKRASAKTYLAALVGFLLTLFLIGSMAQGQVPAEVLEHGYADMVLLNGKIVTMDDRTERGGDKRMEADWGSWSG